MASFHSISLNVGPMTSNQLWVPKCSTIIQTFFPPQQTQLHLLCIITEGKQSSLFHIPLPLELCPSGALDRRKTRVQLCSSSLHLYVSFMSPFHLLSLLSTCRFLFLFHFVLWTIFFSRGHCPLPFVHNVRLFIFHSCLLPCLFYSPPSSFFFLSF